MANLGNFGTSLVATAPSARADQSSIMIETNNKIPRGSVV